MGRCIWGIASNLIWQGREAQAGSSKADFTNKVRISLREMRESNYWLRLIIASDIKCNTKSAEVLLNESRELKNILGSIIQKLR